jgi:dihydroorotase
VSCGGREITGKCGLVKAVKLYPAGATTNSQAGVTDLFGKCMPVLEEMVKQGLPLLVKFLFWTVFCVWDYLSQSGEKTMQVLVLVLISGHVVVFHVKTQFS